MSTATRVAIVASGNIGTDLMINLDRSEHLALTLTAQKQTLPA